MIEKLLRPEIEELIESREWGTLREVLLEWHPSEVAELIKDVPENEEALIFRILPKSRAADVFEYLDLETQKSLLQSLGRGEAAKILNEMSPDDRTAFLEELPGPAVRDLISLLSPEERAVARSLLGYPEESVGRIMSPDYVAVKKDWTIKKVLSHVRLKGRDSESLNVIYVIDDQGKLIDDIRIREILLASPGKKIKSLMTDSFVSLLVTDTKQQAVSVFRQYDRIALPVVNAENYLVGMVTVDDVLDVAEEQSTAEIQKFGGVQALDMPYINTPILQMVQKRGIWLVVLFFGELLTASAMAYFEEEIAKAVVLALFIPLIISSGGNTGSQAATLMVRAMALGEVRLRDWWRVMGREVISGILLGLILGMLGFLRIAVWAGFTDIYGPHWLGVAFTVGFSLLGVVLWGTLSGSMLPFLLKRLGVDPATSSAPFVATLVDVTGIVIYFLMAGFFLRGTLL